MGYADGAYGYGRVERALGVALHADEATQRGALRGRLKRLSTLGLPPAGPGKGSRRLYSLEEVHQLLAALMMEDAGLDPTVVAPAVIKLWAYNMRPDAESAASAPKKNPVLIVVRLQTVTGPWRTGNPHAALPSVNLVPRFPSHAWEQYKKLDEYQRYWRADSVRTEIDTLIELEETESEEKGWVAVHNFSRKAGVLETALLKAS